VNSKLIGVLKNVEFSKKNGRFSGKKTPQSAGWVVICGSSDSTCAKSGFTVCVQHQRVFDHAFRVQPQPGLNVLAVKVRMVGIAIVQLPEGFAWKRREINCKFRPGEIFWMPSICVFLAEKGPGALLEMCG